MSIKINTTNTIKNTIKHADKYADKHADAIAYFDPATDRVKVIPASDCKSGYFDEEKAVTVNKVAELAAYECIKLLNAREFVARHPEADLETYIASSHTSKANDNPDFYVAAYIHLFRLYKSFEVLTENDLAWLIDSFIDNCVSINSDHPSTLSYYKHEVHKVLKLRKTVFNMFVKQVRDYNSLDNLQRLQNLHNFTDKEIREFIKKQQKQNAAAQPSAETSRVSDTVRTVADKNAIDKVAS